MNISNAFNVKELYQYHRVKSDDNFKVEFFSSGGGREDDADSEDEQMKCIMAHALKIMKDYDCGQGAQAHI